MKTDNASATWSLWPKRSFVKDRDFLAALFLAEVQEAPLHTSPSVITAWSFPLHQAWWQPYLKRNLNTSLWKCVIFAVFRDTQWLLWKCSLEAAAKSPLILGQKLKPWAHILGKKSHSQNKLSISVYLKISVKHNSLSLTFPLFYT